MATAKTNWGGWTFNKANACLEYPMGTALYQIPVYEMSNSAKILDWIFQIKEKTWATSQVIGDLVAAIVDILGRGVAGSGIDHTIDSKKIINAKYGIDFS